MLSNLTGRASNEGKNITVDMHVEPDLPHIRADRNRLMQVITNVVDNSFNYTYAGGSIEIDVRQRTDKAHVLIAVKDTGIGIPEEFQPRVWERFERYEEHALVMDVAGTGLGLPIAKNLVEMHNGEIWFESEVNKGTTFFISLPIRQAGRFTTELSLPGDGQTAGQD